MTAVPARAPRQCILDLPAILGRVSAQRHLTPLDSATLLDHTASTKSIPLGQIPSLPIES